MTGGRRQLGSSPTLTARANGGEGVAAIAGRPGTSAGIMRRCHRSGDVRQICDRALAYRGVAESYRELL